MNYEVQKSITLNENISNINLHVCLDLNRKHAFLFRVVNLLTYIYVARNRDLIMGGGRNSISSYKKGYQPPVIQNVILVIIFHSVLKGTKHRQIERNSCGDLYFCFRMWGGWVGGGGYRI